MKFHKYSSHLRTLTLALSMSIGYLLAASASAQEESLPTLSPAEKQVVFVSDNPEEYLTLSANSDGDDPTAPEEAAPCPPWKEDTDSDSEPPRPMETYEWDVQGTLVVVGHSTEGTFQTSSPSIDLSLTAPGKGTVSFRRGWTWHDQSHPEAKDGGITWGPWSFPVDEVILDVKIKELSYSGADYHEIRKDDDTESFQAPHWVDSSEPPDGTPEESDPVAFTRKKKPKVAAKFHFLPDADSVSDVTISVEALGNGTLEKIELDENLELPERELKDELVDTIKVHGTLDSDTSRFLLNWTAYLGESSRPAGSTKTLMYVTLGKPKSTVVKFQTLFEIGCRSGDGKSDIDAAFLEIWKEIKDREVKRVDGGVLTYWGPAARNSLTSYFTYEELIKTCDGKCGAWAKLLIELVRCQGETKGSVIGIRPKQQPLTTLTPVGFFVKNWTFASSSTLPLDQDGIPGQNNPDPSSVFQNHGIVDWGGVYYDPSYGMSFSTINEWEEAAIDVFEYKQLDGGRFFIRNMESQQCETY